MTRWFWITILAWFIGGIAVIHTAAMLGVVDRLPFGVCVLIGLALGVAGIILAMWIDVRALDRRERRAE
jgi:hypothetical protein